MIGSFIKDRQLWRAAVLGYSHETVISILIKGANPQRVTTEILIEIKQFYSGQIASNPFIESIYGVPIERSFFHRKLRLFL